MTTIGARVLPKDAALSGRATKPEYPRPIVGEPAHPIAAGRALVVAVDGALRVPLGEAEDPVQAVGATTDTDGPPAALAHDTALQCLGAGPNYAHGMDRGPLDPGDRKST